MNMRVELRDLKDEFDNLWKEYHNNPTEESYSLLIKVRNLRIKQGKDSQWLSFPNTPNQIQFLKIKV